MKYSFSTLREQQQRLQKQKDINAIKKDQSIVCTIKGNLELFSTLTNSKYKNKIRVVFFKTFSYWKKRQLP